MLALTSRLFLFAASLSVTDMRAGCERFLFQTVGAEAEGGKLYQGVVRGIPPALHPPRSYRVEYPSAGAAAQAKGESYQTLGKNNRLMTPTFGQQLVKADDPRWLELQRTRLEDCLARGYTGVRVDFALTTLQPSWVSSGVPSDWDAQGEHRVRSGVTKLLESLAAVRPDVWVTINGLFVDAPPFTGFQAHLQAVTGGDVEYFAFRVNDKGQTEADSTVRVLQGLQAMIEARRQSKVMVAQAAGSATDGQARLSSLAAYLLVASDFTYYYYSTDMAYQGIEAYPEWAVPLGKPESDIGNLDSLRDSAERDLLVRRFARGRVYYNSGKAAVTVRADSTMQRLTVTGGRNPELGGDGALGYAAESQIELAPGAGAIFVGR